MADQTWLRILRKTVPSVVELAAGASIRFAFASSGLPIPAEAAGPIAAVIKALFEAISKEASALERKLDIILGEPLETARHTLHEVLTVRCETESDLRECDRHLAYAFDNLRRAYAYAVDTQPSERGLIRLYLAMVAALKEGGKPFARLYADELRSWCKEARNNAARARSAAADIDPSFFEENRGVIIGTPVDYLDLGLREQGVDKAVENAHRDKERLGGKAIELDQAADSLDYFCRLVEYAADNRRAILLRSN